MKILRVGIASREAYKKRTLALAKGQLVPPKNRPTVWFESLAAFSLVLSDQNRDLLKMILQTRPQSLKELALKSRRAPSNLSRALRMMERYGLVHFEHRPNHQLVPRVNFSGVRLELSFQD